ncbi:MAG: hypothetical protein HYS60_00960 [Candidatus Wildermuthbacteria bacterium]|nr:hypothetical protein [Candidatus Wildermuthbacteria bacterium]
MEKNSVESIFQFLSVVNNPGLQDALLLPKFILGSIGLFFLFFIIFAIFKSSWIRYLIVTDAKEFLTFRAFGVRKMAQRWQKALARLQTANEAEYKLAIIDADSMLDESLKRLGFGGANLEERLKLLTPVILPNVKDVERVHALRNNIVHDPNFILSLDQARDAMEVYEKAFLGLDLI